MELQLTGTGNQEALSLQEQLVVALRKAFEVAVDVAVQEVTKVVGRAAGEHEKMTQEIESLRQRLMRAEAMTGGRGGGSLHPTRVKHTQQPRTKSFPKEGNGLLADCRPNLQRKRGRNNRTSADSGATRVLQRNYGCVSWDAVNVGPYSTF